MSRLLVVDDDIQMLAALEAALRRKGHTVETASNGIEAASKLENTTVQAVITDLQMPGMDGLELLHHVRRTKPAIPVIVLSAYGTVPTAVEAIKGGAADFIEKPFSHEDLDAVLRKHVTAGGGPLTVSLHAGQSVGEMERKLIMTTLEQTKGNRTHAAKMLGISLRTLRNKLREYRGAGIVAI